jgi:hypothetical protein
MTDQTETLWVIFMTPTKKLLTKISSLKNFGKFKIEELKVMYGRKSVGGWIFKILDQPASSTYSFHDGDIIRKTKTGYTPLRNHGGSSYLILGSVLCAWLCVSTFRGYQNPGKDSQATSLPEHVQNPVKDAEIPIAEKKTVVSAQKNNPEAHDQFLEAKKDFQNGHLASSLRIQKNLGELNVADKTEASNMISEVYFLQCENWMRQHEERKAVIFCEKSLKFSAHPKAASFLNLQEEKARSLYLEGYTLQKFNPAEAKQKYALVLQSAKTKSSWRGKAQYQLRKLKNPN